MLIRTIIILQVDEIKKEIFIHLYIITLQFFNQIFANIYEIRHVVDRNFLASILHAKQDKEKEPEEHIYIS